MEKELIDGFKKIFLHESREPMIALDYEADVCPLLSMPEKLRYVSKSGSSIDDATSKVTLPDNIEKMIIDVSCSTEYHPMISEIEAITKLITTEIDHPIDVTWGFCYDALQQERAIIRLLMTVKPKIRI